MSLVNCAGGTHGFNVGKEVQALYDAGYDRVMFTVFFTYTLANDVPLQTAYKSDWGELETHYFIYRPLADCNLAITSVHDESMVESTNYGSDWAKIEYNDIIKMSVTFSNAKPLTGDNVRYFIQYSEDDGTTWSSTSKVGSTLTKETFEAGVTKSFSFQYLKAAKWSQRLYRIKAYEEGVENSDTLYSNTVDVRHNVPCTITGIVTDAFCIEGGNKVEKASYGTDWAVLTPSSNGANTMKFKFTFALDKTPDEDAYLVYQYSEDEGATWSLKSYSYVAPDDISSGAYVEEGGFGIDKPTLYRYKMTCKIGGAKYEFYSNILQVYILDKEDVNMDGAVDTQDVLKIYDFMKQH